MNIKRHKGRLNCFVTCSIKDREPIEINFKKKMRESAKGVTKFFICSLIKHKKAKEITKNIPKN